MPLIMVDCIDHVEHLDSGGESYTAKWGAVVRRRVYAPPLFILQHAPGARCILCEAESRRAGIAAAGGGACMGKNPDRTPP